MNVDKERQQMLLSQIATCLQCNDCGAMCPFSVVTGNDAYSPQNKILQLEPLMKGEVLSPEGYDAVYLCSRCGACNDACPAGIDIMAIIQCERGLLQEQEREPQKTTHISHNILTAYNPKGAPNDNRNDLWITEDMVLSPDSTTAYMAGCWIALKNVSIAHDTMKILNACGITPRAIEGERCCGLFLIDNGHLDDMRAYAKEYTEYLEALGIKTIITSCPACYKVLGTEYEALFRKPAFEVKHVLQVYKELYDSGKLSFEPQSGTVALRDACPLKDLFDIPRELLAAAGYEVKEIKNEHVFCCGAPAGAKPNYPEISGAIGKVSLERSKGSDAIATYCSFCKHHLDGIKESEGEEGIPVEDIASLLVKAMKR